MAETRLRQALARIIEALPFADAGLVLISRWDGRSEAVMGVTGFDTGDADGDERDLCPARSSRSPSLGEQSIDQELALCRHA